MSCSSGNPYFIDLDLLEEQGLLTKKELRPLRRKGDVDYGALYTERYQTLRTAYSRFFFDSAEFRAYVDEGTHEDYALFMTAKTVFGGSFASLFANFLNSDQLSEKTLDELQALIDEKRSKD